MKLSALSIVILTNRIDERFQQALNSSQFADSVFVVDNCLEKNQESWKVLQKKYDFQRIEYSKTITDFSKARNEALKHITTPWVLFLDSDEVLSENAALEIQNIIELNTYDAITIQRVDYFLGKPLLYGEAGNTSLVRMFKVKLGKFTRAVHETVVISGTIGQSNFYISHFSHDSINTFLKKITNYASIESKNRQHSQLQNSIQLCTYPIAKFIYNYFLKLGFLDGYRGLLYAVLMSLHSFFVRVFYYETK